MATAKTQKQTSEVKTPVEQLREVIKNQKTYDIYNIMGAIRGGDKCEEHEFKAVTCAIRSYIGFNYSSCSGFTIKDFYQDKVIEAIDRVWQNYRYSSDPHYPFHLVRAIESIGYNNLIDFVKKNTQQRIA